MISTPNGTVATADVTSFVEAAKAAGQDSITLAVNMVGKSVDKANRIFFVSKEGAESYANAENMAPVLVSTKTVAVSGIKVNAPTKTVYDLGESLDTTGMTVTASYEDGTEDVVDLSKVIVTGFDSSKVTEKQTVTVKYAGQTATFDVEIRNFTLENAKEDAVKAVNDKVASITAEIEKLANLSEDQKAAYKADVEAAVKAAETAINAATTTEEATEAQTAAETSLDSVLAAAKDADKKAEPTPDPDPTPEPEPTYADGLANEIAEDGNWYVRGGAIDFSFSGKVSVNGSIRNVKNGKVSR